MEKRLDLDTINSDHTGFKGFFEKLLRRFKSLMHLFTMIPVYLFGCLLLGVSLVPGIFLFRFAADLTAQQAAWIQNIAYGLSFACGYLLYGLTLISVLPLVNFILRTNLKPWRGPYYSAESFNWYIHNALTYLARYTFLEFITPSPLNLLFYQMMGMKIGRGTAINTTHISDPSLIEIGEKVTLGGSVTVVAHYGQGGMLIIAPVKIGDGCTIGLRATVMGGTEIGPGAKVLPHSVVMPKTVIPAGEIWGGIPAQKIELSQNEKPLKKVA